MIEIRFTGETAADVLAMMDGFVQNGKIANSYSVEQPCDAAVSRPQPQAPVAAPSGPIMDAPAPAPAPTVPTTAAPGFSLEQVGKAGADLITTDPGKMPQLMGLLQQYGVPSIQNLRPDQIGPFATALRGLGAKL